MTFARRVTVEVSKEDRYGRWVGRVLVAGSDINLRQIEAGMAWHYKAYEREQRPRERLAYSAAEKAARASKTGLWSARAPVPPWDFRRPRATRVPGGFAPAVQAVLE